MTYEEAIKKKEQDFINHESDLISISNSPSPSPLTLFLSKSHLLKRIFRKRAKADQFDSPSLLLWSDTKMQGLSNAVTIVLGLLMLYGPLWWLNWVSRDVFRLGIITGFVTLFALGLSQVGEGKPFEVLAATAAYAAVLMVFMQQQAG